jgi:hypothetical protein
MAPRPARGKTRPAPLKITSGILMGSLRPGQQIVFASQTPLSMPDTSKIRLYETTESKKISLPFSITRDSRNSCKLNFSAELLQGKKYLFVADSTAFRNIYGECTDSTGSKFTVRNNDTFGRLTINIDNFDGTCIVQLLTVEEKIMREILMKKEGKVDFAWLDAGKYRVRVIYDLNSDGKWTTGDFTTGREPEPVSFFPQEFDVKENWEINQDWDIGEKNAKKIITKIRTAPGRK